MSRPALPVHVEKTVDKFFSRDSNQSDMEIPVHRLGVLGVCGIAGIWTNEPALYALFALFALSASDRTITLPVRNRDFLS